MWLALAGLDSGGLPHRQITKNRPDGRFFVLGAAISVLATNWQRPRRKTGPFCLSGGVVHQDTLCHLAATSLSRAAPPPSW